MRIAIDLHACQQADMPFTRASLTSLRHMLDNPNGHAFWIAFDGRFPAHIERLRAAFTGLLPAERVLAYDLPALGNLAGAGSMLEAIKENFFASRGIDLVFTPGLATATALPAPLSPHFINAIGIPEGAAPSKTEDRLVVEMGADPAHAAQQALRSFELAASRRQASTSPTGRPALAWIAAQAPGPTDAHARLLAGLAQRYEVSLILPAPQPPDGSSPCTVRTIDWFEQHAGSFQRIVYSVGNSARHRFMRGLLARHPGIVFLHDFSLGAQCEAEPDQAWRQILFDSHGFTGLADALASGRVAAAARYPLNKSVLDLATGVIAASDGFLGEAQTWYGPGAAAGWRCVSPAQEAPERACAELTEAIEAFARHSPAVHYRTLIQSVRAFGFPRDARHPSLLAAARAIAANQPATAPRQLLVDVSAMAQLDAKTGISRVVRGILLALIAAPPSGYRVEAVYGDGGNRRYRYARNFTLALLGAAGAIELDDAPIEQRPGDIFVGVDVAASITTQNAALFADMRNQGVQVYFVVHDILPVLMPAMFAYGTDTYFRKYLETIARHADGLLCTTRAGADTLAHWVDAHRAPRPDALRIGHFHLGADLAASAPSTGLAPEAAALGAAAARCPTLLMVGTLEPRKAQAQALAALELLWSRQVPVNLVIVGKPGWMVEPLIRKLKAHPRLGTQLFWLAEASDEMLASLYGSCSALLAPSLGEGFGLPLIEAARHGLPIVARKLPVFEEICGAHAFYFEGETPHELAAALDAWLALLAAGKAPASAGLPWLSWEESARRLCDCVVNQHWYRSVPGTPTL